MDEELIERLALEAGMDPPQLSVFPRWGADYEALYRFAALVAEECAQRCDEVAAHDLSLMSPQQAVEHVAAAIRAKFKAPS